MKIIWHANDIEPGRMVGKRDCPQRRMICGVADRGTERFALVSLADGMMTLPCSAEMLAIGLTTSGELPVELLR